MTVWQPDGLPGGAKDGMNLGSYLRKEHFLFLIADKKRQTSVQNIQKSCLIMDCGEKGGCGEGTSLPTDKENRAYRPHLGSLIGLNMPRCCQFIFPVLAF